jgi:hypothetical protein
MRTRFVAVTLPLLLAVALPSLGQQGTAEIGGRITDQQGAALPGVTITATNEERRASFVR